MLKLISWNVNGLRACYDKGFTDIFRQLDADFFCLQETKMQAGQLDLQFDGYQSYWNYAEKKGYSVRNLAYMCQFARSYPLGALRSFIETDAKLLTPSVQKITDELQSLNNMTFTQEPLAQFQTNIFQSKEFTQEPLAQIQKIDKTISAMLQTSIDDIEKDFVCSPISKINWTSHVILLDSSLPLGNKYWYMKQSVENG